MQKISTTLLGFDPKDNKDVKIFSMSLEAGVGQVSAT
jgi:hypothetical protein